MKTKLLVLALVAFAMRISAQTGNLIVFTEGGERFSLVLNGVLQNSTPQTNVKVTDLPASPDFPTGYKMKIIFADAALGTKDFNTAIENGNERTVNIKKNNKGEYVQRMVSDVPLAQAPPTPSTQTVYVYTTTPPPPATTTTTTTVSKSTTTSSTSGAQPTGENVSITMGVNMNENGGGVNMNMSGMDGSMSSGSTTTTTTTHTTTTSGNVYSAPPPPPPAPLPGYNGPVGCPMPMDQNSFQRLKSTITSKSFEESKLTIAKQVLNNNCLITSQVKELMLLFDFETSRLDFAKYAYGYTYDIGNYFMVNDAFTFESSIDDLNTYISSYRR
jgi:hypothetical protein